MIPRDDWKWFGSAGHFIMGNHCRFHLCTLIGDYLVSTVGQLWLEEGSREITAKSRGVALEGRGDEREYDYMREVGFEKIGSDRLFETMVFKASGKTCTAEGCNCGMPLINGSELDFEGYNESGAATVGHMVICERWALELVAAARRDE